jgi:hypothetical protein
MPPNAPASCPVCTKDDRAQKVTGLVNTRAETPFEGYLTRTLARPVTPSAPSAPQFQPASPFQPHAYVSLFANSETSNQIVVGVIVAGVIVILALFGLTRHIGAALILGPIIVIGAAIGIYSYVENDRRTRHEREESDRKSTYDQAESKRKALFDQEYQQYQQRLNQWREGTLRIYTEAQRKWDEDLYYCHRDDVVFLAGGQSHAPPNAMSRILGL